MFLRIGFHKCYASFLWCKCSLYVVLMCDTCLSNRCTISCPFCLKICSYWYIQCLIGFDIVIYYLFIYFLWTHIWLVVKSMDFFLNFRWSPYFSRRCHNVKLNIVLFSSKVCSILDHVLKKNIFSLSYKAQRIRYIINV